MALNDPEIYWRNDNDSLTDIAKIRCDGNVRDTFGTPDVDVFITIEMRINRQRSGTETATQTRARLKAVAKSMLDKTDVLLSGGTMPANWEIAKFNYVSENGSLSVNSDIAARGTVVDTSTTPDTDQPGTVRIIFGRQYPEGTTPTEKRSAITSLARKAIGQMSDML